MQKKSARISSKTKAKERPRDSLIQPKEIGRTEEEGRASQSDPFKAEHCLFGPFKRRLKRDSR